MNKPIRTISIFCLLLFVALMINATWLQYWKADSYDKDGRNRRVIEAAYSRERGAILVAGKPVAESEPSDDQYDFLRTYPEPFKYSHVTGYFSFYDQTGIERSQNDVLSGDDDVLFVNKLVDLLSNKSGKGGNVQLTLDRDAQDAAYAALGELPVDPESGVVQASVVAIEPSTGRILAMASLPTFDPNKLASHDFNSVKTDYDRLQADPNEPLLNRAIQTTLPPGSTFKLVTAAAAIESGKYDADSEVPGGTTYQLPQTSGSSGEIDNEGRSCGTDKIPFSQAMENSCNTTFAQLGVELGGGALQDMAEKFGFNDDHYLDDIGPQATSKFPQDPTDPEAGQSAIGQFEVRASPLQMAMVAAGIANQGMVMKPYIVDSIQSPELETLRQTEPEEYNQAISAETADQVTQLMVDTVNNGTASPGAIAGIQVAGKTGTAQSGLPDVPPYAWFVSFAPAQDPEVAVAVVIQKAGIERGEIAGGTYGGPIAKAVMEAVIK